MGVPASYAQRTAPAAKPALHWGLRWGLHWLRPEIEANLARARALLEQHLDGGGDGSALAQIAAQLQTVRGALSMIQRHGAARLAAEMLSLLAQLRAGSAARPEEGYAALSGASLQLSDYLDLLASGEPDRAVLLQPVLNELRAARGQPLLTEAELFAAQAQAEALRTDFLAAPATEPAAEPGAAQAYARQQLGAFQQAFLQWFRGMQASDPMARLGEIAAGVAGRVRTAEARLAWTGFAALAEALRGAGDSLELKRLFGRAGSLLKTLAEQGEDACAAQIGDTPWLVLWQLAQLPRPGERAKALLDASANVTRLPSRARLDQLRRCLRAPGSGILERLNAEIREDFTRIKDGIDLAVRTGGRLRGEASGAIERLRRLATTLAALGQTAPQQALLNQARALEAGNPDALTWMEVATAILRVEHSLGEALFRSLGRHGEEAPRSYAEIESQVPHSQDLRDGLRALLRESLLDCAQIRSAVEVALDDAGGGTLIPAAELLHEIAAGLKLLGHERAAASLTRLEQALGSGLLTRARVERFADALACAEVYLEALRDELPQPLRLSDDLAAYVERFVAEPEPAQPAPEPAVAGAAPVETPAAAIPPAGPSLDSVLDSSPDPKPDPGPDPEMRAIFAEEAEEVLAALRRGLPALQRDPASTDAITPLRRGFHTLKGSGRTVGAQRIAAFGWSLERLLNRCLDGSQSGDAAVAVLVAEAIELLPGLIDDLRHGSGEDPRVALLLARADALAEAGRTAPETDLRNVFQDDARQRLGAVQHWLEQQDASQAEAAIDADLVLAFHTLKGSAAVVNAVALSRLASAAEQTLGALRQQGRGLSPAALALFGEVTRTSLSWITALAAEPGVPEDAAAHLQAALAGLLDDAGAATAATGDRPAAAHVDEEFAIAALDIVQRLEAEAHGWPQRHHEPVAATLHGGLLEFAARAAAAPSAPLAQIAEALAGRLAPWAFGCERTPGPELHQALGAIFEGWYQLLDRYRDGTLRDADAEPWLARIARLPAPDEAAPAPTPAPDAPAGAAPATFDDFAFEGLAPDGFAFDAAPEQAPAQISVPPAAPVSSPAEPVPVTATAGAAGGEPEPEPAPDAELLDIFIGEADELLEVLQAQHAAWQREPHGAAPAELRRALHTLKGSARTAGAGAIGSVAHRLESLLDAPSGAAASLPSRFAIGLDGLQNQTDALRRGEQWPAAPVIAAIDAAIDTVQADAPADLTAPAGEAALVAPPGATASAPEAPAEIRLEPLFDALGGFDDGEAGLPVAPEPAPAPELAAAPTLAPADEPMPAFTLAPDFAFEPEPAPQPVATAAEEVAAPIALGTLFDGFEPAAEAVAASAPPPTPEPPSTPLDAPLTITLEPQWPAEPAAPVVSEPARAATDAEPGRHDEPPPIESLIEPLVFTLDDAAATAPTAAPEPAAPAGAPFEWPPLEPPPLEPLASDFSGAAEATASPAAGEPHAAPLTLAPAIDAPVGTPIETPVETASETASEPAAEIATGNGTAAGGAPEPAVAAQAPAVPPAVEASSVDPELRDLYSAEAAELLANIGRGFEAWSGGDAGAPVLELLRALHTLKGGARVAGLPEIAAGAHALESRINALLTTGDAPDAAGFAALREAIATLRAQHEPLGVGEIVRSPAGRPAPVAAAPIPELQGWARELFWKPEAAAESSVAARREMARVPVDSLDQMLSQAGEVAIVRSRIEEATVGIRGQLGEMTQTLSRVREQLRLMDIETDAQIAARGLASSADRGYARDFDPLELDRYSRMQELSRALAESMSDLAALQATMTEAVGNSEALLQQQGRAATEVQQGLMGTLMVPFARQAQRLQRLVRQTAQENGRQAELLIVGAEAELDRNVLERMTAPLEHLLRNAVVHGIETPERRRAAGKPEAGSIRIELKRDGAQLLLQVADDGAGLNLPAIRDKAVALKLMPAEAPLADDALARFIFEPGFSTAPTLTQDAGRGIGMDVVSASVKQLGGSIDLHTETGAGTRFRIRLPLTLAVSQVLMVGVGEETYALPLPAIEGIARIPRGELAKYLHDDGPPLDYGGHAWRVRRLADFIDLATPAEDGGRSATVVLIQPGDSLGSGRERRVALVVDRLIGNREIVSKGAGAQLSSVPGVTGATLLADGRVVLILDVPALLLRAERRAALAGAAPGPAHETRDTVMVVDDSVTMRRVAERLLSRAGYRVVLAKDGLDAIAQLQNQTPRIVLLDIEMPRADGFEVASFIRNSPRLGRVPIVMITSRSGDKHRARAEAIGVDRYLTKPYQEEQLLAEIASLLGAAR